MRLSPGSYLQIASLQPLAGFTILIDEAVEPHGRVTTSEKLQNFQHKKEFTTAQDNVAIAMIHAEIFGTLYDCYNMMLLRQAIVMEFR